MIGLSQKYNPDLSAKSVLITLTGYAKGYVNTGSGVELPGSREGKHVPSKLWRGRIYVYMYKNPFAELQALLKGFVLIRFKSGSS